MSIVYRVKQFFFIFGCVPTKEGQGVRWGGELIGTDPNYELYLEGTDELHRPGVWTGSFCLSDFSVFVLIGINLSFIRKCYIIAAIVRLFCNDSH